MPPDQQIAHTLIIPPTINGVSASQLYLPALSDQTIRTVFDYVCTRFDHIAPVIWQQRFSQGRVLDHTGQVLSIDSPYQANSRIFYYRELAQETPVPFAHKILFENDYLLAVDKPHFLTISPTGQYVQQTLLVRLKQQTGLDDLTPIHRLDRETAGIVLFSKKPEARHAYQSLFSDRKVLKIYHAIAAFKADLQLPQTVHLGMQKSDPFYTMRVNSTLIPNSKTSIRCLMHNGTWAKYELIAHTGKQHQLRVHLNHLGIPIKNDALYPQVQHRAADDFSQPLQLLAQHIEFIDPFTLQKMQLNSTFNLDLS